MPVTRRKERRNAIGRRSRAALTGFRPLLNREIESKSDAKRRVAVRLRLRDRRGQRRA